MKRHNIETRDVEGENHGLYGTERDEVCRHCGEDGTEHELDVHHIVPVREFREDPDASLGDAHELDDLVLLCKRCHTRVEHGTITVSEDGTP